jgi:hypothetical protein
MVSNRQIAAEEEAQYISDRHMPAPFDPAETVLGLWKDVADGDSAHEPIR